MCLMLMLGIANYITASFICWLWLRILNLVVAVFSIFMAYIAYRRARKIAKAIDATKTLTLTIIHYGEENKSKGEEQGERGS